MEQLPNWLLLQELPAYLLMGAAAGLIAGLLGVGGGLLIVPALVYLFRAKGFHGDLLMHLAVGTSLASIVATSVSAVRAHHGHKAVQWPLVARLLPGLLVGALLGAVWASVLPTLWLQRVFAGFVLIIGLRMLISRQLEGHWPMPGRWGMGLAGSLIGSVSALVGIGGGTLMVPFLNKCRLDMRRAVATSSACGLPIALAGSLGFVITGWGQETLPAGSLGYVYMPAAIGIAIISMVFAPIGAWLAHRVPVLALRRGFALLLLLLGINMML